MAMDWNSTALPWQETALPWKAIALPWNEVALPWKQGGGSSGITPTMAFDNAANSQLLATLDDF
jgi:hypothetical protein